jgi:hypothetical protein
MSKSSLDIIYSNLITYQVLNNCNIGIGKENPSFKLDVNGDINFTSGLKLNGCNLPFSFYTNTNVIASNAFFSYINNCNNFAYYQYLVDGLIRFPQTTSCDVICVGAGGNGGLGSFSGGGGAGEVIVYPNFNFNSNINYNIQVGLSSFNSNMRISRISSNNTDLIRARGGGDGGSFNSTSSRRYPSKNYTGITSETNTTFNGKACKTKNITLDTTGITYGSGTYELYYIRSALASANGDYAPIQNMFNNSYTTASASAYYFDTKYDKTSGVYNGTDFLAENSYLGSWVVIKIVSNITLKRYVIDSAFPTRRPLKFRLYGSTNGTTWTVIDDVDTTSASYISNLYDKSINTNNLIFNYYGLVINKITPPGGGDWTGDAAAYVGEWELFGQEVISITNPRIGGSGGGGIGGLLTQGGSIETSFNPGYSNMTPGSSGTSNMGGNGGSATLNGGLIETITGSNLILGIGGSGATSNSVPNILNETTYGTGGDGNGGFGTQGTVIIRVPLNIQKPIFNGYIDYNNIDNKPYINTILNSKELIDVGYFNQINFPMANVAWANEWFLYMGMSPSLQSNSFIFWHNNSNSGINSKWWFNGTIANTNNEISDGRVKKEINEIQDPISKLMTLKPKEYYLCDDKDYLKKYGIIAQDVKEVIPELVYTDNDYIANIYSKCNYSYEIENNRNLLLLPLSSSLTSNIHVNDELKLLLDNNDGNNQEIIIEDLPYHNRYKKRFVKVKEIIDERTIEIYEKLELTEIEKENLFIYGKKTNDFLKLDYSSIYTLNVATTQELIRLIEEQSNKIKELEERILILENNRINEQ